ncbi:enoyl-CoA hydratase/isomerase family protein [Photobacterium aphoticum]|uniref:Enoyl-CoA hydratase/isomerase family protein n=1 Tax=Photobacterium aphoticum TaxID=754436 RepID=A0A090QS92_9GAMM|nr:enoyl-CoA hydratase/isomerase family protein [Photobacterium aphoticum]
MNAQSNLLAITHHNGIATVAINNPPVNVITSDLINAINAFVLSLKDDRDTKWWSSNPCMRPSFWRIWI